MRADGGFDYEQLQSCGEFVTIRERVVVSPGWGRVRLRVRDPGQSVEVGEIIGWILEGGRELPLRSHVRGPFLRWLAREGERVSPGSPVALLRAGDAVPA
ncbi:MAG: hypothetical protein ACRDJF_11470 [Actinomycetota bacterium]